MWTTVSSSGSSDLVCVVADTVGNGRVRCARYIYSVGGDRIVGQEPRREEKEERRRDETEKRRGEREREREVMEERRKRYDNTDATTGVWGGIRDETKGRTREQAVLGSTQR